MGKLKTVPYETYAAVVRENEQLKDRLGKLQGAVMVLGKELESLRGILNVRR